VLGEADLIRRHVGVLFTKDGDGRLVADNEPDGDRAPRLYLARGRSSSVIAFRDDTPEALTARWQEIADRLPAWDGSRTTDSAFDDLRSAVGADGAIERESIGPAFRFGQTPPPGPGDADIRRIDAASAELLEPFFPYTRTVLEARAPVVGAVVDGAVVAACFSARRNADACEAGVATEEPYQGRGLATAVVAAWGEAVEADGREPLYSTWWDNAASLGVARRLRLIAYAETLSIR
jgi:GNAT superfamily N-acetyltransferase